MIRPVNGSGMKRMALLNDLSCFGKCSLSVAMPILSSYGVETVPQIGRASCRERV